VQDEEIVGRITRLVEEEHGLRREVEGARPIDEETRSRLEAVEVQLDQCWDLLRQRRARREFADDPDAADVREPEVVEGYEQ
jgi:hypothetical protein